MSHPSFVGIRELDQEILLGLDDSSLGQSCQTDKWTQSICADPLFWREKILRKYGLDVLQHKPVNETFYQQYQRLSRIQYHGYQYYPSVVGHHLDEMIALNQQGIRPDFTTMEYAFSKGDIETIDWLFAQGIPPSSGDYLDTIMNDSLEKFKWMIRHGGVVDQQVANLAMDASATKILEYLFREYNLLPQTNQHKLGVLAVTGELETLIWLDQHNLGLPDQRAVNFVNLIVNYLENERPLNPEELQIVNAYIRPNTALSTSILSRIPVNEGENISWDQMKRYMTQEEIDQVRRRYRETLNWLISRGVHPQ